MATKKTKSGNGGDKKTESILKSVAKDLVNSFDDDDKTQNSTKKSSSTKRKTTKSKQNQAKDLAKFGVATVVSGVVASKSAGRGKTKKQKAVINIVVSVLVIAVLICGGMYYFDQAPFDFSIGGNDDFKFYSYENYEYNVSKPNSNVTAIDVNGKLLIHFIDVGQGDSIFIEFPDGQTMLIDGAKKSNEVASGIIDYILSLYPNQTTVDIDYLMLTHCDADHCGSLDDVIASDKINVKNVYQPRVMSGYASDPLKQLASSFVNVPTITTGVYNSFVEAVYNEMQTVGTKVNYNFEGEYFAGTNWSIHMYNPSEDMYTSLSTAQDKNNISPIMVLKYNDIEILFTGDADDEAERNFMENLSTLVFDDGFVFNGDVEVLKVGHHGGRESTSSDFLSVVKPENAVISVGQNKYGHPRQETLDRLKEFMTNENIYRTDERGNVVLSVTGNQMDWIVSKTNVKASVFYNPYETMFNVINGYAN